MPSRFMHLVCRGLRGSNTLETGSRCRNRKLLGEEVERRGLEPGILVAEVSKDGDSPRYVLRRLPTKARILLNMSKDLTALATLWSRELLEKTLVIAEEQLDTLLGFWPGQIERKLQPDNFLSRNGLTEQGLQASSTVSPRSIFDCRAATGGPFRGWLADVSFAEWARRGISHRGR